jgi:hypothetical protein
MKIPNIALRKKNNFSNFVCRLLHAVFFLGLFFDPENEGEIFHRNFG